MNRAWTNVLFIAGLLCTAIIGGAQTVRLLNGHSATVVWYASFASFLALNIGLSVPPFMAKRNWVTIQPLVSYGCYMVMILLNLAVIVAGGRAAMRWTVSDQLTVLICLVGIIVTFITSRYHYRLPATDPIVRGVYALFFKAVPQFLLAWNIAMAGGGELAGISLLMGHCTILIRMLQIRESFKEMRTSTVVKAKRRYLVGTAISETGNELSWLVVTATWCYRAGYDWTVVAALGAALLHITAYGLYTVYACKGKTRPNATVWGIWAFLGLLNCTSYAVVTDLLSGAQFIAGSVACLIAFAVMLFAGQLNPPTRKEWNYIGAGLFASLVWYLFKSAAFANFIILAAYGISTAPLIIGLWKDPKLENPTPWWLWTVAFIITTAVVIAKHGLSIGVVSPVLFLAMHLAVALMTYRKVRAP